MPEKRNSRRVSLNLPVTWDGLSGGQEARIEDISLTGCFVNTTARMDPGHNVVIDIQLPEGDWLQIPGAVVTSQHGIGFGVKFSRLTPIDEEAIRDLLK
jgi:PilZ domain